MARSSTLSGAKMEAQDSQNEKISAPPAAAAAVMPCRKNKRDGATFLEDLKDHIDKFINASMEDHNNCFMSTMQKMFGISKVAEERSSATEEVSLPLQTTTSN